MVFLLWVDLSCSSSQRRWSRQNITSKRVKVSLTTVDFKIIFFGHSYQWISSKGWNCLETSPRPKQGIVILKGIGTPTPLCFCIKSCQWFSSNGWNWLGSPPRPRLRMLTILPSWMQVPLLIMAKKMEAAMRRRQNKPSMIRSRAWERTWRSLV